MKLMEILNVVPNGAVIRHRIVGRAMIVKADSVQDFVTREEVKFSLEELQSDMWYEHPCFSHATERINFNDFDYDPLLVRGKDTAARMAKTIAIMNLIASTDRPVTPNYKGKYCYVPILKEGKWQNHRVNHNTPAIFGTTTPDSCQQVCDYLNRNKW